MGRQGHGGDHQGRAGKACRNPYDCWRGRRVFILASGPSLTEEDAQKVKNEVVIAVNCSIRLAPFAACLYAGDFKWWQAYEEDWRGFGGMKATISAEAARKYPEIRKYDMRARDVLSREGLATGNNSGYQAANLAFLHGATEIYLLGVDCKANPGQNHWHPDHAARGKHRLTNPSGGLYRQWAQNWTKIHKALEAEGVKLVNCSRDSALTIPRMDLESVLDSA